VVKDGKISSENYTAENIEAALRRYEGYGLTTVLSLGVNKDLLYGWRARQRAGEFSGPEVFTADRGLGVQRAAPPIPVGKTRTPVPKLLRKRTIVREMAARHPDIIRIWVDDFFGATEVKSDFQSVSPCLTSGPTFVTLRPWKRTLSASDSGPTPRRAKSDFLSVEFHHGSRDHQGRCRDLL
jgi:hypothetical protein